MERLWKRDEKEKNEEKRCNYSSRKRWKSVIAVILSVLMVTTVIDYNGFINASAQTLNELSGTTYNISNGSLTINSENLSTYNNATITGSADVNRLVIDGVTINLTFRDLSIMRIEQYDEKAAVTLQNGAKLNLTLDTTNYVRGGAGGAGINVPDGCTLTITAGSTGTLYATGGNYYGGAAGIGANGTGYYTSTSYTNDGIIKTCGTINIEGGTVIAQGGTHRTGFTVVEGAAGIGGSRGGTTGNITISGGNVTATGGGYAAGIGGGINGFTSMIAISGGTVIANGTDGGAAIGSGRNSTNASVSTVSCGIISISGGTVTANGNIGYGYKISYAQNEGGSVEISSSAYVTVSGKIEPAASNGSGGSVSIYNLSFTVYDGRLAEPGTKAVTVTLNGKNYAANLNVAEKYVGTVSFNSAISTLTETKNITITDADSGYTWSKDVAFQQQTTSYSEVIGEKMCQVTLLFYDATITENISNVGLTVTQTGITLNETATNGIVNYIPCENTIACTTTSVGSMQFWIAAGTTTFNLTTESLNEGKTMTAENQIIVGNTNVVMYESVTAEEPPIDSEGYYLLSKPEHLIWFTTQVKNKNLWINGRMTTDIDMEFVHWTPIGTAISVFNYDAVYKGTFDGQGYTIRNLNGSLFGAIQGATVKNIALLGGQFTGVYIGSTAYAGSLVTCLLPSSRLENCISDSTGTGDGGEVVGGLVGYARASNTYSQYNIHITNCAYIGDLTNITAWNSYKGALIGKDTATVNITNCYYAADGVSSWVGWYTYANLSNCYFSGENDTNARTELTAKTKDAFTSGEVAYLLNGSASNGTTWYQTIGTDDYPVPFISHGTVYQLTGKPCPNSASTTYYSNINSSENATTHTYHYDATQGKYVCMYCNDEAVFTVTAGGSTPDFTNMLTIASAPTVGMNWSDVVKLKDDITLTASFTGATDSDFTHFTLKQTGTVALGNQTYQIVYNGTLGGKTFTNEIILSGTVTVEKAILTEGQMSYTIPTDVIYNGSEQGITVTAKNGVTGLGEISVKYRKKGTEIAPTTAKPVDAGDYEVFVSVADGTTYAATTEDIHLEGVFTIASKPIASGYEYASITKYDIGQAIMLEGSDLVFYPTGGNATTQKLIPDKDIYIDIDSYEKNVNVTTDSQKATVDVRGIGNYTGKVSISFSIVKKNITEVATVTDGWTNHAVITTPIGYTISSTKNGTFGKNFIYSTQSADASGTVVEYYLKEDGTGCISAKKLITVKVDTTLPTFDGEGNGITIKNIIWKEILSKITFGLFSQTTNATILATDSLSGIEKYYYFVDTVADENTESYTALTADALVGKTFTESSSGTLSLSDAGNRVVYAYAVDKAGNRSAYICSNGVVIDNTAPALTIHGPSDDDLKDTSAIFSLQSSEMSSYYYSVTRDVLPNVQSVADIKNQSIWGSGSIANGQINTGIVVSLSTLTANTNYYICAVAVDAAGNESAVLSIKFTTRKTRPEFSKNPSLNGIYGQRVEQMKLEQLESTNGVAGTWTVTDTSKTDKPDVGTTNKYEVTFTPTDTDTYESVTVSVTSTITARSLEASGVAIGEVTDAYSYNGTAKKPSVSVTDTGALLTDKDYVFTWSNNINAYTLVSSDKNFDSSQAPTVTITGKGNYTGTVTRTFIIDRSAASIFIESGSENYTKTYGDGAFALTGITKTGDGELTYEVTDGKDVVSVSNGIITILNPGTATVTVSMEATGNYKSAVSKTINIIVEKKDAPSVSQINKIYIYSAGTKGDTVNIDIASLLPVDRGTTAYSLSTNDVNYVESEAIDSNGNLTYKVGNFGSFGDNTNLVVTVSTQIYKDITITIHISLADKLKVEEKVGCESAITGTNSLTYGSTLSSLALNTTQAVFLQKGTDIVIPGMLAWTAPDAVPTVGTTKVQWTFTPDDSATYAATTGEVAIVVTKAIPSVTTPVTAPTTYNPSVTLDEIALSGTNGRYTVGGVDAEVTGRWNWKSPSIVPTVNNSGYTAVFTPDDQINYSVVEKVVTVVISKATPYIQTVPTANSITYGDTLASAALSGGHIQYSSDSNVTGYTTAVIGLFSWKNADTKPSVSDSNHTTYTVVFTPDDTVNYNIASTAITLTVNKAQNTPNMPGPTMNPSFNSKKVSEVPLNEGWSWAPEDQNKELTVGTAVSATAVYMGSDAGNYEKETVVISITRSSCTHLITEVRNAKNPTCTENGYTGDIYCTVCETKISSGTTIAALGHNYTSKITKEPTTTEEGIRTYTCTRCGASYTEMIKKLEPQARKPFIQGKDGKQGWDVIIEEIGKVNSGDTVTIDMNQTTIVPGNVINSIKGKDITIEFDLGNGIKWKVNGKDVTIDNIGDINFAVTLGTVNIPVDIINEITGAQNSIQISLDYDGEFGFKAVLSINLEEKNAGFYANLFYYNKQTGKLEFMNAGKISKDGSVELTFTHASEYTIVVSDTIMNGSQNQTNTTPTQTGDETDIWKFEWILVLGGLILIIGLGGIVVRKKREVEQ